MKLIRKCYLNFRAVNTADYPRMKKRQNSVLQKAPEHNMVGAYEPLRTFKEYVRKRTHISIEM